MQIIGPRLAQEVRKKMAREGVRGTKQDLDAIYSKRFNEAVSARTYMHPTVSCH